MLQVYSFGSRIVLRAFCKAGHKRPKVLQRKWWSMSSSEGTLFNTSSPSRWKQTVILTSPTIFNHMGLLFTKTYQRHHNYRIYILKSHIQLFQLLILQRLIVIIQTLLWMELIFVHSYTTIELVVDIGIFWVLTYLVNDFYRIISSYLSYLFSGDINTLLKVFYHIHTDDQRWHCQ